MSLSVLTARLGKWLAVLGGLALCLILDAPRPSEVTTKVLEISSLRLAPDAGKPASLGPLPAYALVRQIDVAMRVRPMSLAYTNLFQTADSPGALRLEFVQPGVLNLALGDSRYLPVSDGFVPGRWRNIRMQIVRGVSASVWVDGALVQRWTDPAIDSAVQFETLLVGTGFQQQRNFNGDIDHFKLTVAYEREPPLWWRTLKTAVIWLGTGVFAWLLIKPLGRDRAPAADAVGAAWVALAAACLTAGWLCYAQGAPGGKWLVLIGFAPLFALPFALPPLAAPRTRRVIGALGAIYVAALAWRLSAVPDQLQIAMLCASVIAWSTYASLAPGRERGVLSLFAAGLALALWASLSTTPQAVALAKLAGQAPASTAALVAGCVAPVVCSRLLRGDESLGPAGLPVLASLGALAALLFAFRTDVLSPAGAEMHWEYLAGPVRAIHSGGWLLWDTPSQYGFLNILLTSLVPAPNEWVALFFFQGATLFAAAWLYWRVVSTAAPQLGLAIPILVAGTFFLADPALIGPGAYPSSSAMRFLWVYVLIWLAVKVLMVGEGGVGGILRDSRWAWLAACFWSAESAVYATTIYLAPAAAVLLASLCGRAEGGRDARLVVRELCITLGVAALAVGGLALYYKMSIGHAPDFGMFLMYSTSYAAGFGELPIPWAGPLAAIAVLLALGAASIYAPGHSRLRGDAITAVTAMAALIAVATYYVGRAAPNNITALTPILLLLTIVIGKSAAWSSSLRVMTSVLATVLVVQWAGGALGGLIEVPISKLSGGALHEASQRSIDAELAELLEKAGVSARSPVVYYGFSTTMHSSNVLDGSGVYGSTWLPAPLQLLEAPIPEARRVQILQRYTARKPQGGYLVEKRGEWEDRLIVWKSLLARTHQSEFELASPNYRVTYYRPKP